MSDEGSVEQLLADRPDLEEPLRDVLDVDEANDAWTFEDVPVDSGPFGELVSEGVVESVGDEYRLADPGRVRAALDSDESGSTAATPDGVDTPDLSLSPAAIRSRIQVDRPTAGYLLLALAAVVLARAWPVASIYRNGNVVLSGNDPYYYRYWVEQMVAASAHAFDPSALASLPATVRTGEPLTVATLWWVADLLGDGPAAVGHVMAWYPVVSAVVTAVLVYLLAVRVTDDRRVAVAAVLFLAIVPGHALRTSLGFADHHAFDYPWLVATALALVGVVDATGGTGDDGATDRTALSAPAVWGWSALLGVAVAGQTLAWEASPLLVAPVGLVVVGRTLMAVRDGRDPVVGVAPVAGGLALATVLAGAGHVLLDWHDPVVAFAPALLLAGTVGAGVLSALVARTTGDSRHLAVADAVALVGGLGGLLVLFPDVRQRLGYRIGFLVETEGIAETAGLFSLQSLDFLLLFGFALLVALPAMAWRLEAARRDERWLVAGVYAWYFLGLTSLQVRFVGELSPFVAVYAGLAFVWLAAWSDETRPVSATVRRLRAPDRGQLVRLAMLFALVASFGVIQTPVETSKVLIEEDTYQTATHVADRADRLNQPYPENYVLSDWGRNRVYNYFVNGHSRSYGYARENFSRFLKSRTPGAWYDEHHERVGYVVVPTNGREAPENTTYERLASGYGSRTGGSTGVGHYRAVYEAPGGSTVTYALVPGARIRGTATPNATVRVATNVTIPDAAFTYRRATGADADGQYAVRVAQPGTYRVTVDGETQTVTVSAAAVRNGRSVQV